MTLTNKVALVTGSGRNLGRAIALAFAREGADVVVNSRSNPAEAELVAEEARVSGVRAIATLADVSDRSQVETMFRHALEAFGRVDILVSNAAIRPQKSFVDLTVEEWKQAIGVILDGAFYCTQAALSSMLANQFGRVIYITGDGAYSGVAQRAHVSAAKMGLTGLARPGDRICREEYHVQYYFPGSHGYHPRQFFLRGPGVHAASGRYPGEKVGQPRRDRKRMCVSIDK